MSNFNFGGGGGGGGILGTKSQNRVKLGFLNQIFNTPASWCITDSLSHTMYVETNHLILRIAPVAST